MAGKKPNSKKPIFTRIPLIIAGIIIAGGFSGLAAYSAWHRGAAHCQEVNTPVMLSDGDQTEYNVAGEICAKGRLAGKTVQLLISGHTYDRTYWDFSYKPETYSYVKAAVNAGYATFNIDRVGVGKSDVPDDPAKLTTPSQAYVIKQLVGALRSGDLGDTRDSKIVLVGHSLGGAIALYAAAEYNDVDAVVSTDHLGDTNPAFIPALQSYQYPANQDPKFKGVNLPGGYVTTRPGKRGDSFYNTGYAESAVINADEKTKQPGTPQAIITIPEARSSEVSGKLRLPVFFPVGEKDALYCDAGNPDLSCDSAAAVVRREQKFFPNACIEAYIQPNSGHDGVLHPNAPDMFGTVNDWIGRRVGKTASGQPAESCM